jgi:CelD/BcsL family acetyltransferase involved in cellulose biosynthesis
MKKTEPVLPNASLNAARANEADVYIHNQDSERVSLASKIVHPAELSQAELSVWDTLSQQVASLRNPFLSSCFVQALAAVRQRVYVGVIEREGAPAAFFPFQFQSALHEAARIASPAGEYMAGYAGLIAAPNFRITGPGLLRRFGLMYIRIPYIEESQSKYGLQLARSAPGHLIRLDRGPQAYWDDLKSSNKKFVAELARRERQVVRDFGAPRFRFSERNWAEALEQVMKYKSEQYRRTGRQDLFADRWRRDLLYAIARRPHPACTAVISTLYAGQTWLASHYGLRSGPVLYYYFPVYNPELHRYSPGHLLLKAIIDASADEGISLIDRGAGDTQAKRDFSTGTHMIFRTAWSRPGLRSFVYRAGCSLMWRLSAAHSRPSESIRA